MYLGKIKIENKHNCRKKEDLRILRISKVIIPN